MESEKIQSQLELTRQYYLDHMDFKDWVRYFYVVKRIIQLKPYNTLEIGIGNNIIKDCLVDCTKEFWTMDINENLEPNLHCDVREYLDRFKNFFDCIIALEILEHIPFKDAEKALSNLYSYLAENGRVFITVPHRQPFIIFSTILNINPIVLTIPKFRGKNWIDQYHHWEIGCKGMKRDKLEIAFKKVGFKIVEHKVIPYHDYYELGKNDKTSY